MHPLNIHKDGYDFKRLIQVHPALNTYVADNGYGRLSIDYANDQAVIALNKALLEAYYGVENWSLPEGFLCPPIPSRADYLLHLGDLLSSSNAQAKQAPKGAKIRVLDIGVGASAIYPLLANGLFGWSFVGSDINPQSINHIENQLKPSNTAIKKYLETRLQNDHSKIFNGIVQSDDLFDLSMCNPPFHTSAEDAERRTKRKWKQLGLKDKMKSTKSFGGQSNELWCEGGEVAFLLKMIRESKRYAQQILWFSSLVSRKTTLPFLDEAFGETKPNQIKVIEMSLGQKTSRFVAWTYLDQSQHQAWSKFRFLQS